MEDKIRYLLGSGSPRRQALLKELGLNFRVMVSHTAEIPPAHLRRGDIAVNLSEEKSAELQKQLLPGEILITADTIVWLDSEMLGKPTGETEAIEMLRRLNGKTHQVYTGVCLSDDKKCTTFCVESNVKFRKADDPELTEYVRIFRPFDKAGAYGAQESLPEDMNPCSESEVSFMSAIGIDLFRKTLGTEKQKRIPLIERIDGSYFNVMGLPIVELMNELQSFNR